MSETSLPGGFATPLKLLRIAVPEASPAFLDDLQRIESFLNHAHVRKRTLTLMTIQLLPNFLLANFILQDRRAGVLQAVCKEACEDR